MWKRVEKTTAGFDPTQIVMYQLTIGKLEITLVQFWGDTQVDIDYGERELHSSSGSIIGKLIYDALEEAHESRLLQADRDEDVELAERKAGWDPKP